MTIDVAPLPLPVSADAVQFREFGKEVIGTTLTHLSQAEFREIENLVYKVFQLLLDIMQMMTR